MNKLEDRPVEQVMAMSTDDFTVINSFLQSSYFVLLALSLVSECSYQTLPESWTEYVLNLFLTSTHITTILHCYGKLSLFKVLLLCLCLESIMNFFPLSCKMLTVISQNIIFHSFGKKIYWMLYYSPSTGFLFIRILTFLISIAIWKSMCRIWNTMGVNCPCIVDVTLPGEWNVVVKGTAICLIFFNISELWIARSILLCSV